MIKFKQELLKAKSLIKTEPDEAIRICNKVLNQDFNGPDGQMALFMVGFAMLEAERYGLAYNIYERCAQLNPNQSEIFSNMGMCLEDYDPDKAIRMFDHAYKLNPKNSNALANKALIYLQKAEPEKCIRLSNKALDIDPELRSARHNRGLARIMLRQWKDGWQDYADTIGVKHREERDYGLPMWDGKAPGTVLIYGEQGVGDEIMFASCFNDVTNPLIIDCDSRLESLFQRSFDCPVYGTRFKRETPILDEHKPDYQFPAGNLPSLFRHTDKDYPGTPYLKPDPEQCIQWRALFDTFPGKKIGIAWRGGLESTGQHKRSMTMDDIAPLMKDGNTYISLEYLPVDAQEAKKHGIRCYPRATAKGGNIDDLTALVSQLDGVITVATTVVYVAGATGVPCHVLVPSEPSYRYHKEGQFPWYQSVKLFRQYRKECWSDTIKRLSRDKGFHRFRSKGNSGIPCVQPIHNRKVQSAGVHYTNQPESSAVLQQATR